MYVNAVSLDFVEEN